MWRPVTPSRRRKTSPKWRDDSGSVLSFGGINVTIDWTQPEGKRIVSATLTKDGSTLDPAKTYTVATNNYIITNTTDFPTFAHAPSTPSGARARRR